MSALLQRMVKTWVATSKNPCEWHWFDLSGSIPTDHAVHVEPELWLTTYRPPFDKTVLVYQAQHNKVSHEVLMTLEGDDPEVGIKFSVVIRYGEHLPKLLTTAMYSIRNGQLFLTRKEGETQQDIDNRNWGLTLIAMLYQRLANMPTKASIPTIDNFINKKRLERNKPPIYTWRTLIVSGKKIGKEDHGGTHASPRFHERRGHHRRLPNGKTVWVKSCKVGDPARGAVFKDYKVV